MMQFILQKQKFFWFAFNSNDFSHLIKSPLFFGTDFFYYNIIELIQSTIAIIWYFELETIRLNLPVIFFCFMV
jgi:hypothetical protein